MRGTLKSYFNVLPDPYVVVLRDTTDYDVFMSRYWHLTHIPMCISKGYLKYPSRETHIRKVYCQGSSKGFGINLLRGDLTC